MALALQLAANVFGVLVSSKGSFKADHLVSNAGQAGSNSASSLSKPTSAPFNLQSKSCSKEHRKVTVYQHARRRNLCWTRATAVVDSPTKRPSQEYNQMMQRQMKNPYAYHHELGMYYTRITDNLIVGSQPQTPADIERLCLDDSVDVILNLQQDHDIHYWGIDLEPIRTMCWELGVRHYRRPAKDFDPHSLRWELPRIVAVIDRYIAEGKTVYVHCTAGLGRAPGAAIAYLFWFQNMDMHTAYEHLTSKRPCGPKKEAIRGATYDLAKNDPWKAPFEHLPDYAFTDVAAWERDLIQQRVRALY